MKLYYFYTLKALWDGQGKIKMYYGMSRVKKQLSGKRSIAMHIQEILHFINYNKSHACSSQNLNVRSWKLVSFSKY